MIFSLRLCARSVGGQIEVIRGHYATLSQQAHFDFARRYR